MNELVYMADIQNKLYEAGLFRQEERNVLSTEKCVLLEYYTGKTYSYRMVELSTLKERTNGRLCLPVCSFFTL